MEAAKVLESSRGVVLKHVSLSLSVFAMCWCVCSGRVLCCVGCKRGSLHEPIIASPSRSITSTFFPVLDQEYNHTQQLGVIIKVVWVQQMYVGHLYERICVAREVLLAVYLSKVSADVLKCSFAPEEEPFERVECFLVCVHQFF